MMNGVCDCLSFCVRLPRSVMPTGTNERIVFYDNCTDWWIGRSHANAFTRFCDGKIHPLLIAIHVSVLSACGW
jgi:hypothetical protein